MMKSSTHLIDFLQGLTLTLSALIDGKNFNQGGHKVMATIHQELSSSAIEIQNIYMHTKISLHLFKVIYPSQRQNLLPTLEIITHNFQNFQKIQIFGFFSSKI